MSHINSSHIQLTVVIQITDQATKLSFSFTKHLIIRIDRYFVESAIDPVSLAELPEVIGQYSVVSFYEIEDIL